jgi:hypothetical protein
MDAASAIIDTEPTTILGATARLRYVAKHESAGNTFDFIDDDDGKTKPWTFVVLAGGADGSAPPWWDDDIAVGVQRGRFQRPATRDLRVLEFLSMDGP